MNYYAIGQQIRKYRKSHGLSQEKLAEMVDISTTHMSHIETGNTKLSLAVLVEIANVLNVRTDDLLGRAQYTSGDAVDEISALIQNCSVQEAKAIVDIIKASQQAMRTHLK